MDNPDNESSLDVIIRSNARGTLEKWDDGYEYDSVYALLEDFQALLTPELFNEYENDSRLTKVVRDNGKSYERSFGFSTVVIDIQGDNHKISFINRPNGASMSVAFNYTRDRLNIENPYQIIHDEAGVTTQIDLDLSGNVINFNPHNKHWGTLSYDNARIDVYGLLEALVITNIRSFHATYVFPINTFLAGFTEFSK